MRGNTPGFPVLHYLPKRAQAHVHPTTESVMHLILAQHFTWHMNGAETAASPFKSEVDGQ